MPYPTITRSTSPLAKKRTIGDIVVAGRRAKGAEGGREGDVRRNRRRSGPERCDSGFTVQSSFSGSDEDADDNRKAGRGDVGHRPGRFIGSGSFEQQHQYQQQATGVPGHWQRKEAERQQQQLGGRTIGGGGRGIGGGQSPLYAIEKEKGRVKRVARTYAFEDYWSILGSVVEKCACMDLSPCSVGGYRDAVASPFSSFENADGGGPAAPAGFGDRGENAGGTAAAQRQFPHWRPSAKSTVIAPGGIVTAPILSTSVQAELKMPFQGDSSDDDEDYPVRMSEPACYVIHEKKAVSSIFREESDDGGGRGSSIIRGESDRGGRGLLGEADEGRRRFQFVQRS